MGGQYQRVDRPGLVIDTKGGRRQEEVETAGFKVIGGAPTALRVTELMMMMMMICNNFAQNIKCNNTVVTFT